MKRRRVLGVVSEERERWRSQFGGGMLAFDEAYCRARNAGGTEAEAQQVGVDAVLDAFVTRLLTRLGSSRGG